MEDNNITYDKEFTTCVAPSDAAIREYIDNSIFDNLIDEYHNILPISIRISARTIGHDLVAVQPMTEPVGILSYEIFDIKYHIFDNDKTYTPDEFFNDDSFNEYGIH